MSNADKPLSAAIAQGWEVQNYAATVEPATGVVLHCFLLRRRDKTKLLTLRKKMLGEGAVLEEMEI